MRVHPVAEQAPGRDHIAGDYLIGSVDPGGMQRLRVVVAPDICDVNPISLVVNLKKIEPTLVVGPPEGFVSVAVGPAAVGDQPKASFQALSFQVAKLRQLGNLHIEVTQRLGELHLLVAGDVIRYDTVHRLFRPQHALSPYVSRLDSKACRLDLAALGVLIKIFCELATQLFHLLG